ncbi:hypothetical protein INR49_024113 [Caranx melampygus]|nr:hypothetical protein INR49_024113 [Caranx melampygus]
MLEGVKPESVPLCPLGTAAAPEPELLCIFGTGDLGRSLGHRLLQSGYRVVYGSRRPHSCGPLPQGTQVMSHAEAAQSASLVFICIHRQHYDFMETLAPQLTGKVLVDVSNNLKKNIYPEANAEYLQRLIPGAHVVKAFNTLSAWALQNGPSDANRQVYLCGNSAEAKQAVTVTATKLGFTVVDRGSLSAARELEDFSLQLFPEWRLSLWLAFGLTVVLFIYVVIRDVIWTYAVEGRDISFRIMVSLANRVFPIVSLIMLSLCYLPGVIAAFFQLYRGTKYRRFPDWLDRWMLCRKQLGVIALAFAFLHMFYTLIIPHRYRTGAHTTTLLLSGVNYRGCLVVMEIIWWTKVWSTHPHDDRMFTVALDSCEDINLWLLYYVRYKIAASTISKIKNNETSEFNTSYAWRSDSLYATGILGFGVYVLLGITSLPSVSNALSWREFSFIQSKLGYLTLFLCTFHAYIYGWNKFLLPSYYKWYTPPAFMLSLVLPSVVIVLKLLLLLPCVDRTLTRIRQGWERTGPKDNSKKPLL